MSSGYPRRLPKDMAKLKDFYARVKEWHAADQALAHPLRELKLGRQYDVALEISEASRVPTTRKNWPWRWNDDFILCQQQCTHFALPPARMRHDLRLDQTVCNMEALASANGKPVYLAKALTTSGQAVDVVVKVYQGSRHFDDLKEPASIDLDSDKPPRMTEVACKFLRESWYHLLLSYRAEALAYWKLSALQGSIVPHVYGFFEVMLPNQEPAMALVMEYVKEDLSVSPAQSPDDVLEEMAMGMLAATHAITNCNVDSGDMKRSNVLWPAKNLVETSLTRTGRMRFPAIIDFDLATKIRGGARMTMLSNGLRSLLSLFDVGFSPDCIRRWGLAVMERHPHFKRLYESFDEAVWESCFTGYVYDTPSSM